MPSPLGHALGGLSAGWLIAGAPPWPPSVESFRRDRHNALAPWTSTWRGALVFAAIGMSPDLDLLVGLHRLQAHSLGAALIVALAAMALERSSMPGTGGTTGAIGTASAVVAGLACGAAYASHILLDWLGSDTWPPIGVMALWPISSSYFESSLHLFMSTTRRYWVAGFWSENLTAVAREIVILVPTAAAIYLLRRRKA